MSRSNGKRRTKSRGTKWLITGILVLLAVVTVVAVAADGCFDFQPGSVNSTGTGSVAAASVDASSETAQKRATTHQIIITAGNGGETDPNGSIVVDDWQSVTINFTPDEGYKIQTVTVDGNDVGAIESYTMSNITSDHSVIATFVKK